MSKQPPSKPSIDTQVIHTPTKEQLIVAKEIGKLTHITTVGIGNANADIAYQLIKEIGELTGANVVFQPEHLDTLQTKFGIQHDAPQTSASLADQPAVQTDLPNAKLNTKLERS